MAIRLNGSLEIVDSDSEIHDRLMVHLAKIFNKAFAKAGKAIRKEVAGKVDRLFRFPNVYDAVVNGPMDKILGIPKGTAKNRMEAIIRTIINNMVVDITPFVPKGGGLVGGMSIGLLIADFSDVLALPESHIYDQKGYTLPWLEWLLIEGDKIIVSNHEVKFGNFGPSSRSGGALMVDSKMSWRVPPEYSGVVDDNWLTRSIDRGMKFLEYTIEKSVEKNVGLALNVV